MMEKWGPPDTMMPVWCVTVMAVHVIKSQDHLTREPSTVSCVCSVCMCVACLGGCGCSVCMCVACV